MKSFKTDIKNIDKYKLPDCIASSLPESFVSINFYEDNVTKTHYNFDGKVMKNEEFVKKFFDLIALGIKISNETKADIIFKKK